MALRALAGTTDRRIDSLLALLADNAMIVISGAKIAREIGVARSTVWNWIDRMRALGVRVKGHPGSGYRIEKVPDILVPSLIRRLLADTPYGKRTYHYFKVGSTNTVAMHLGEEGEPHGAIVLAEEQTAGRGRAGRTWISEKSSGIHVSVLLRPAISPLQAPLITMVAGLAARDAIAEQAAVEPDLRWPNDVLIGRRKCGGILTEMQAEPDCVHFVVAGIGINVNQTEFSGDLASIATSLRIETGRTHSRIELLARLLRNLDRYYNQFLSEGAPPILQRFAAVSSFVENKRVRISTALETYVGTSAGLDPSGLLRVRRDDGRTETVMAADITEAT